jgi:hypothetical protein
LRLCVGIVALAIRHWRHFFRWRNGAVTLRREWRMALDFFLTAGSYGVK